MIDDIALHGKIHFADVAISFAMPCVKELEDVMEGQALLQATSALEDSKLQHLSNRTKGEMVKQN